MLQFHGLAEAHVCLIRYPESRKQLAVKIQLRICIGNHDDSTGHLPRIDQRQIGNKLEILGVARCQG